MDLWLPPLALIGCIVVVGPLLAFALQNAPDHWVQDHTVALGVVLTLLTGVVLVMAFALARKVVLWRRRLLRIDADRIAVCSSSGKKEYAAAKRDEVDVERRKYVIRAQQGTFVTPVLMVRIPDYELLTMTVGDTDLQWSSEVDEVEEEANYALSTKHWQRLVEVLDLAQ